ncbi:MAG TPA: S53 family peptidase [Ktedonobacteraceae bacterium]|nr:S53 family peptidase [Ktedonobacteraceae bacterium]
MHRSLPAFRLLPLLILVFLLAACTLPIGNSGNTSGNSTPTTAPTHGSASSTTAAQLTCPAPLNDTQSCYTPYALRVAYDVEPLTERGYTGKGQTIIDIVSYGSPTLQQDMDVFDRQFGLPPINIQVVAPLGTVPFNPNNKDMVGWAGETELDVQIMHAIAPGANIVVMTSPVDETEGTVGLPQFLKLEQYAVAHHLGQIFSQSYVASEATLIGSASQQFIKNYANFYQQITTRQGITIVNGSGDNGATDWENIAATKLASTRTVNFPADVPWVTAVGGTTLLRTTGGYDETAWSGSGGGTSKFFSEPDFQRSMPSSVQSLLGGQRGIPDIAADADPNTGMAFYLGGQWDQTGGTSASTPFWAAIIAIANQMAGHPLGFINPGIYKLAASPQAQQDFRDVITGNNSVNGAVQVQGFPAAPGWDAVTGWGSPRASKFIPDLIAALR